MKDRFEGFTYLIMESSKLTFRIKNQEMKEYSLKAIHVMTLYYLNQSELGLTSKELVKTLCEDKAAVSRSIAYLKEKGYLQYDDSKYNFKVKLTESGKKMALIIEEKASKAVESGGEGISNRDRITFYKTLAKINKNLEEYIKKYKEE